MSSANSSNSFLARPIDEIFAMASSAPSKRSRAGDTIDDPIMLDSEDSRTMSSSDSASRHQPGSPINSPIILDVLEESHTNRLEQEGRDGLSATAEGDSVVAVVRGGDRDTEAAHPSSSAVPPSKIALAPEAEAVTSSSLQGLPDRPQGSYDNFTLFPKLPLEIRCMIWRYTFPGPRLVSLVEIIPKGWTLAAAHALNTAYDIKLPIALQINMESRQETLRSYYVVRYKCLNMVRLILNPNIDRAWINFEDCRIGHKSESLHRWISYLTSVFSPCIKQIKHLDITGVHWSRMEFTELNGHYTVQDNEKELAFSLRSLLFLSALQEVRVNLSEHRFSSNRPSRLAIAKNELKAFFERFFDQRKDSFADGKTPVVVIREFGEGPLAESSVTN